MRRANRAQTMVSRLRCSAAMPRLLLLAILLGACGTNAPPDVDAGAEPDAGPPSTDPLTARFDAVTVSGAGPWNVWGFVAVSTGTDRAIVIGGTDAGSFGGTVYETVWDVSVTDGALSATELDLADGPLPRYCGCAAYDADRDVVVVFGGRDLTGPTTLAPETWELDPGARTWTRIDAAAQPVGTLGCAMAFAPSAGQVYLFGGASLAGHSADTYRYDPGLPGWERLDASGPLPRYDGVLFPSKAGDALYLFGGSYNAVGAAFYSDLWRFDPAAESWTEVSLPSGPGGRRTAWIVHDPALDGLYVGFGYDGSMQPYGDLWYLDLAARRWTEIAIPLEGPAPRGFSPSLPGGPGALGTVVGGFGAQNPAGDAWQLVR